MTSGLGWNVWSSTKSREILQVVSRFVPEVNPKITKIRHEQKWVDEIHKI